MNASTLAAVTPNETLNFRKIDTREYRLFQSLDIERKGEILVGDLINAIQDAGLSLQDARIRQTAKALEKYSLRDRIDYEVFCDLIRPGILIVEQALQGGMIIPDFKDFCGEIDRIYEKTHKNKTGKVADYIPQLSQMNPEFYGLAICTIDGQQFSVGDTDVDYCVQSCHKPINYCLALEEQGEEVIHRHVGREPSGRYFNDLALNDNGKPHNPMVNAGAIMCSSLIKPEKDAASRFAYVLDKWKSLCGNQKVGFNNAVYQSERKTADRNYAIGYLMQEHRAFPEKTDLHETLEFYFQICSIEANAKMMSILAATFANGGVCPTTGERIFKTSNVQHCLTLMCSCGMYDFSGEFAFEIGLPAKSGVGGAIWIVIPNVMGICVWSPRLDSHGNSVRGIEFCKELVKAFNVHNYDILTGTTEKTDPRVNRIQRKAEKVDALIWAASKGDLGAVHRLVVRGFDQDAADYDKRTPLHLAAAEGRKQVIRYLIENGADPNPEDRWGGTPLDDAFRHGHKEVIVFMETNGGKRFENESCKNVPEVGGTFPGSSPIRDTDRIVELIYAASEGDLDAIRRLVARGVDLGGADYDLRTPLHLAAAEGHEHVVEYFIGQGVNVSPRDRWGGTPLDDAKRHGHARVVQLLESCL